MSQCPDDLELARFLDRTLADDRARALEDHFDRCRECRQLAFALAALDPALDAECAIAPEPGRRP